jgi:hypothetical protein
MFVDLVETRFKLQLLLVVVYVLFNTIFHSVAVLVTQWLGLGLSSWGLGFHFYNMQLYDYNSTSVAREKSASSLTLPNIAGFLVGLPSLDL